MSGRARSVVILGFRITEVYDRGTGGESKIEIVRINQLGILIRVAGSAPGP